MVDLLESWLQTVVIFVFSGLENPRSPIFSPYGLPSAVLGRQDDVEDADGRLVGELATNGGHIRVQRPRKPPEPHFQPIWAAQCRARSSRAAFPVPRQVAKMTLQTPVFDLLESWLQYDMVIDR